MGNNTVIIKSNKYGLVVILDDKIPFDELIWDVRDKFRKAADFFKNAQMVLTIEGRKLSKEEENEIIFTITDNTRIQILCVVDENDQLEEYYKKIAQEKLNEIEKHDGQFYKGTLRSGQVLETETSVIVLGDVNPGANVVSKGNVIILGACKGNVYAGANGNRSSFVAALFMNPIQIRIADCLSAHTTPKKSSEKEKEFEMDPQIAFIQNEEICTKPISRDVLGEMTFV